MFHQSFDPNTEVMRTLDVIERLNRINKPKGTITLDSKRYNNMIELICSGFAIAETFIETTRGQCGRMNDAQMYLIEEFYKISKQIKEMSNQ